MIKDILQYVDLSHYRALILSNSWGKITIDINGFYSPKDGFHYSGQLRMFHFPSGAMIWVHPIPKNDDQLHRYNGMEFQRIVIDGEMLPSEVGYIQSRIGKHDEADAIPLSLHVNGLKVV